MEYKITKGKDIDELETEVNNLLNEGFRPFGKLIISSSSERTIDSNYQYSQVMIKDSEISPIPSKVV